MKAITRYFGFGILLAIVPALLIINSAKPITQIVYPLSPAESALLDKLKSIYEIKQDTSDPAHFTQYSLGYDSKWRRPAYKIGEGRLKFTTPKEPNRICDIHFPNGYYQVPCLYERWYYEIPNVFAGQGKYNADSENLAQVYEFAPYKWQGMSLPSYYEWDGYEIWRADYPTFDVKGEQKFIPIEISSIPISSNNKKEGR